MAETAAIIAKLQSTSFSFMSVTVIIISKETHNKTKTEYMLNPNLIYV